MSLSSWILRHKILALGIGALSAFSCFILYKQLRDQDDHPHQQPRRQDELPKEIKELKDKININNIRLEDLKEILNVSSELSHQASTAFNEKFRDERRKKINTDFKAYIRIIMDALNTLEQMSYTQQQKVLDGLGLSAEKYQQACMRHEAIFDYQTAGEQKQVKELSINEIRNIFEFQKKYLTRNGKELQEKIKASLPSWDPKSKSLVSVFVSYALADVIFAELGIEEDQIEQATNKYKAELATEMEEVRELIVPLLKRAGSSGSVDDGYNPAGIEGDDQSYGVAERESGTEESILKIDPALKEMENMEGDPEVMQKIMELMHEK